MKLSRIFLAVLVLALAAAGFAAPTRAQTPSVFYGGWPFPVPPKGHLNSFVPDGIPGAAGIGIYTDLVEPSAAMFKWADGSWIPLLGESWGFEGDNKYVLTLRKDATWSDGSPVTADDVLATYAIGRLRNFAEFTYVDTLEKRDDYTVVFNLKQPSTVVERLILRTRIRAAKTYGAIAEKVNAFVAAGKDRAGANKDEWDALVKEIADFRPDVSLSSGPYTVSLNDVSDAQLVLRRNENSVFKNAKFDQIVLFNGETEAVTPLFLSKEMYYGTYAFPLSTERAMLDAGIRILRSPTYSGPALFFNHAVAPFDKPEVRQAFAYVIDRAQVGAVALGESGKAVQYMTGFSDNLADQWLSDEAKAGLEPYALNLEKATELLTAAGWKKEGDAWVGADGQPVSYELSVPAEFTDWFPAAENVVQQLNDFGIKTELRGTTNAQHLEDVKAGKFQLAIRLWGIGNPHPFFAYRNMLVANAVGKLPEDPGIGFNLTQTVDGQEVDLNALLTASGAGVDLDAQKASVGELALAFNKLLPLVPLFERYGNTPLVDEKLTGVPAEDDPIFLNAFGADSYIVLWLLDGTIGPK